MTLTKARDYLSAAVPGVTDAVAYDNSYFLVLFNDGTTSTIRRYHYSGSYVDFIVSANASKIAYSMAYMGANLVACFSASHRYTWLVDLLGASYPSAVGTGPVYEYCFSTAKQQQSDGHINSGLDGVALCGAAGGGLIARIIGQLGTDPPKMIFTPELNSEGTSYRQVITTVCWRNSPSQFVHNWILGTTLGTIIDCTTTTIPSSPGVPPDIIFQANYTYTVSENKFDTSQSSAITSMHHHNGWVVVGSSDGFICLVNHLTKQIMQRYRHQTRDYGSQAIGPMVSRDGGVEMLVGYTSSYYTDIQHVSEWDIFRTPMKQKDIAWINNYPPKWVGISGNHGWAIDFSGNVFFMDISNQRSIIERTETCVDSTNPATAETMHLYQRLGKYDMEFHTPFVPAGQVVPMTVGNTYEIASSIGSGIHTKFDVKAQ